MSITEELNRRFLLQEEYLGVDKPINKIIPIVSVVISAYRHLNYIEDCLDSILNQKTDFPYEVIVGEDESDDGTREICIKYAEKHPEKIRLFLRDRRLSQYYENEKYVSRFNGIWNKMSARGNYIALCDGDDYWTDPLKLQNQVEFLEANPKYGMIYAKSEVFLQNRGLFLGVKGGRKENFNELLLGNSIPALTTCFRKNLYNQYLQEVEPANKNWKMGDYPMWLFFAHESKIKFDQKTTGVYRILESSASHSQDLYINISFVFSTYDIAVYFLQKYLYNNILLYESIIERYMWIVFTYWCRISSPKIENQIINEIEKIQRKKSVKINLIRLTFKVQIFRYLFIYYYKIRNGFY